MVVPSQWVVDLSLHMGGIRSPMPPGVVVLGTYVPGIRSLVTVSRANLGGSVRRDLESHAREAERELIELFSDPGLEDPGTLVVTQADIQLGPVLLNGLAASLPLALLGLVGVSEGMQVPLALGSAAAGGVAWSVFRAVEWRRSIDRSLREVRVWFRHFSSPNLGPTCLDVQFLDPGDAPAMLVRVLPLEPEGLGGWAK